jgi:hypothetical protein
VAAAGVTVIDCSVTVLTVRVVEAENPPAAALIVVDPFVSPDARPPGEVIVATGALDDVHAAVDVRSRVLPSL